MESKNLRDIPRIKMLITKLQLRSQFQEHPGWLISLLTWVFIMISTPIGLWIWGGAIFPLLASAGVLAQGMATFFAVRQKKSWAWTLKAFLIVGFGSWVIEWLGSTTGFPFGHYDYTTLLQPQISGVPLLIPAAWWMMLIPSWGIAESILGGVKPKLNKAYPWVFALTAGAAMTAWDFYLDPQMVAQNLWTWQDPTGFFGIPWVNFWGWWLSASLLTIFIRPDSLPRKSLLTIYTITWLLQFIGLGLFWGHPGPALVGFACMGFFVIFAWKNEVRI